MEQEQQKLAAEFGRLVEGLRSWKLGPDRPDGPPCTPSDQRNCRIPNVRIGVVSSDLGAGNYALDQCQGGGDGGRLQNKPHIAGCTPPSDPWISYTDGATNIPGAGQSPVEQVKAAFQCIALLGTTGCGYEHQLESARRALDPNLPVNPGFLREDAFLAVVFITDEDDCSAAKPGLFDPSQKGLDDPLGPGTSFRCTEFGIRCDKNGRQPGPRTGCVPGYDWLHKVEDYVGFFRTLKKQPDRVMLFAIAGPTEPFEVGLEGQNPVLKPSCQSKHGGEISFAVPAVRIASVVKGMAEKRGHFNRGLDDSTPPREVEVNICSPDFGPAMKLVGDVISIVMGDQCLAMPPLTREGGLACRAGDALGGGATCRQSCLDQVDCQVEDLVGDATPQLVDRCPADLFDPAVKDCGASCPCWRIVPVEGCDPSRRGSPYGLQVLRRGDAPKGTTAKVQCVGSVAKWGSTELGALPQCK
jgi:hypothetical protein